MSGQILHSGPQIVLGLETSCDETAAAVVALHDGRARVLSSIIASQIDAHAPYGGVVPEIAARAHVDMIDYVILQAMTKAGLGFQDLTGVAATAGPGLIGGVMVGLLTGKAIALARDLPLVAVNHLEGHALSPRLEADVPFPYLLLLVSGGHCQLLRVAGLDGCERLGSTIDDAVGEAFDKTAKVLGGSTVWITSVGAAAINPALYDKLPYDMVRDFTPVSLVVNNVEVLVTSAQNPATDVVDFVQRARAANVPVPMASSGMGSIPHLALLQMQEATKLDLLHVPFNGMAPALTNLLGGQVAGVFADVPAVMGQIKAGRLKALGMASRVRHPGLPEVRTFEEMGFPAVDTNNWYAFFVSSKTPRPIVDALNAATRRALADPAVANRLLQSGAEPRATTPEEMAALLRADTNKWAALIKARNIRLDS